MTESHERSEDPPQIEEWEVFTADTTRWKPSTEIEDQVLETLTGVLPLELRASDQTLEQFYERGYQLYKTGQYKAALPHFQMLNMVNPRHPKYLMAAAACNQMMKEYHAAVGFYTLAAILDDQNPYPQYYLAGCLIKLEEPLQALVALEMGVNRCADFPHFQSLKDRMQMMMDRLHHELEEKKAAGTLFIPGVETDIKPKEGSS